jgi:hypothetical protein
MKSVTKTMLSTFVIAAAGALTGTLAQADGHHTEQLNAELLKPSTVTRAQVRAELKAARQDGSLARSERDAERGPDLAFGSTRTRAAVTAEAAEANRSGRMARRTDPLAASTH